LLILPTTIATLLEQIAETLAAQASLSSGGYGSSGVAEIFMGIKSFRPRMHGRSLAMLCSRAKKKPGK
jgi:hypothetical protein